MMNGGNRMEIKICTNDTQLQALAKCAKEIWNEYFIRIISQEQINYMVANFQSYPALYKAIHEDHYVYFLAYERQELIGYCGVQIQEERLFLSKLYVKANMRGKKVSSKLLNEAVAYAKSHACQAIYLTCNKYNTPSLQIYAHKGFQIIDSITSDIGQGFVMDDYILQLNLDEE